jgi:hypothetical protein
LIKAKLTLQTRSVYAIRKNDIGVSLEYIPQFLAHLVVHNISNCSVVITGILLKTTNDDRQASSFVVNLDAHSKETINIAKYLVDALGTEAGIQDGAGKVFLRG